MIYPRGYHMEMYPSSVNVAVIMINDTVVNNAIQFSYKFKKFLCYKVRLDTIVLVNAIHTQGRPSPLTNHVKQYTVQTSTDCVNWHAVTENGIEKVKYFLQTNFN